MPNDDTGGARHHVALGFGPHQCLDQNLALAELQIVFDTLFRRILRCGLLRRSTNCRS